MCSRPNVECVKLPLCCHLKRVGLPVAIIFLHVNVQPFSFFTRTTRAKINPGHVWRDSWSAVVLTADGDLAVLPAHIRLQRVAPRSLMDTACVAARVASIVQHRRQVWSECMSMRKLFGPSLAAETAVSYVDWAAVVASVTLVTVDWSQQSKSHLLKAYELIDRLDSRTLPAVNLLGLLDF